MITFTGRRFWPLDPRAEDVSFRDIGHALSLVCRYGGHVRRFYSVAEHSVALARYLLAVGETELAPYALLHDAAEAYIGDMVRPLKRDLPQFSTWEAAIERVIFQRAGLLPVTATPTVLKAADSAIIANEARELFAPETIEAAGWALGARLPHVTIVGDPPHLAEKRFATTFRALFPNLAYD